MSLSDSPLSWVLGALIALAALGQYNVISATWIENYVLAFSTWIFVGGLAGAYMLSQREIGNFSDWETTAFGVGIGGFALYNFSAEMRSLFASYQPWSGYVMVGITLIAFYILTNEDI